ncbi:MAG: hypothetical protein AAFV07_13575, partial [Bacteroidota bacterium]
MPSLPKTTQALIDQIQASIGFELNSIQDVEQFMRDNFPQSYLDVMTPPEEMVGSMYSKTVFLDAEGNIIGLNFYDCGLRDEQVEFLQNLPFPHLISLNLVKNKLQSFHFGPGMNRMIYAQLNRNPGLQEVTIAEGYTRLARLEITHTALQTFRVPASCTDLFFLEFTHNDQLTEFIFDGPLPRLMVALLRGNALKYIKLPAGFDKLVHLYLNFNQLTEVELEGEYPALLTLQLRENKLNDLPRNLLHFPELETLYVHNNPLEAFPKGIIPEGKADNALSPVVSYLKEAQKGESPNTRVKLIIVGNGRVGKTSLYRRLKGLPLREDEPYTHGIQLGMLDEADLPNIKTDTLQLNVWDFGGQEIFYATHQFFLSDNALYLLAWTAQENVLAAREKMAELYPEEKWRSENYWLENIRLHTRDSPILMVQTQVDKLKQAVNARQFSQEPYHAICYDFSARNDQYLQLFKEAISVK